MRFCKQFADEANLVRAAVYQGADGVMVRGDGQSGVSSSLREGVAD